MTEPKPEAKRWSSPDSDVDPVLRSVLRYGRDLEPTSAQLGAIVAAAAERSRPTPRRGRPRALWSVAAIAAVFVAGAAFAGYAVSQRQAPTPKPSAQPSAGIARAAEPASPRRGATPAAAPEIVAPTPPPTAAPEPTTPKTPAIAVRSATKPTVEISPVDPARDAQLLQAARGLMASNPSRALNLTRDHALHFPSSALNEERQALQIEALARLGRRAEAAAALTSFRTRFPRSIHARRLEALGLP